jgi:hypothetical protein
MCFYQGTLIERYYLYALLRGAPSSPLKEGQKQYLKTYTLQFECQ